MMAKSRDSVSSWADKTICLIVEVWAQAGIDLENCNLDIKLGNEQKKINEISDHVEIRSLIGQVWHNKS